MPAPKVEEALSRVFRCSFCLKPQTEVAKLVAGPGVFICDACVGLCVNVMGSEPAAKPQPTAIVTPDKMPTEGLLALLAGHNRAFESVDTAMQDIVDIFATARSVGRRSAKPSASRGRRPGSASARCPAPGRGAPVREPAARAAGGRTRSR